MSFIKIGSLNKLFSLAQDISRCVNLSFPASVNNQQPETCRYNQKPVCWSFFPLLLLELSHMLTSWQHKRRFRFLRLLLSESVPHKNWILIFDLKVFLNQIVGHLVTCNSTLKQKGNEITFSDPPPGWRENWTVWPSPPSPLWHRPRQDPVIIVSS